MSGGDNSSSLWSCFVKSLKRGETATGKNTALALSPVYLFKTTELHLVKSLHVKPIIAAKTINNIISMLAADSSFHLTGD